MTYGRRALAIGAALTVMAGTLVATPAFAESTPSASDQTLTLSKAQTTTTDPAEVARINQLVAAFNTSSDTFNSSKVPASTLSSADGRAFVSAITAQGARVGTGTVSTQSLAAAAASKKKGGTLWIDAWGVHVKASAAVISALIGAAAGGGGSAAAIAGVLIVNVEGFPVSTGAAITSGTIAAGLFAAAGMLALCNLNGKGAQLNYNWVTWTCWPL